MQYFARPALFSFIFHLVHFRLFFRNSPASIFRLPSTRVADAHGRPRKLTDAIFSESRPGSFRLGHFLLFRS